MSTYSDRVTQHPVLQTLVALNDVLDKATAKEDLQGPALEGLARLKAVSAFASKRLAAADPLLLAPSSLDTINGFVQAATNDLQTFLKNGQYPHVAAANKQADALLPQLMSVNTVAVAPDVEALRDASVAYRAALDTAVQQVAAKAAEITPELHNIRTKVGELAGQIEKEQKRITEMMATYQSQFSAAQESRSQDHSKAQSARQDQFQAVSSEYKKKLDEQIAAQATKQEVLEKEEASYISELHQEYVDKASEVLRRIEEHEKAVEKLVGVIGDLGVTSGYQKAATAARNAVWLWQSVTVVAIGGLIWIAYHAFLPLSREGTLSWPTFAGKVVVSLTCAVLAAYAASQADRYQGAERRNRKLALELEAIGPYLSSLSAEKQSEFKLLIGERSFGVFEPVLSRSPATMVAMLKSKETREFLLDLIRTLMHEGKT